jgi:hypothetical protein
MSSNDGKPADGSPPYEPAEPREPGKPAEPSSTVRNQLTVHMPRRIPVLSYRYFPGCAAKLAQ